MADGETSITVEELAIWLTPREALSLASQVFANDAQKAIWGRLNGGVIRAAASNSSRATPPNAEPALTSTPTIIPARYWGHYSSSTSPDFWQTGDARFFFGTRRPRVEFSTVIRCFGIRLDPASIRALLPAMVAKPQNPLPASSPLPNAATNVARPVNKGGRPRKEWWDDLWVEICRQIYTGDLQFVEQVSKQADIEKAMLEWASEHGHDVSEASIRKAANKLFRALQSGG
jgi:hypothetical protein